MRKKYERIRLDIGKECWICGRRFAANDKVVIVKFGKKIVVYCHLHDCRDSSGDSEDNLTT